MVRRPEEAVARRRALLARLEPALRRGPMREGAFTSPLHDERLAAVLGVVLGVAFAVCFVTGVLSHLIQNPPGWFTWPPRPAGAYRITQGLHVATGIAAVPLLLAKLWVVYPHLWSWPPVESPAHLLERMLLLPLVGGSLFLLGSGIANIAGWYPWPFGFIQAHYAAAWITIGALAVHVGAKLPAVARMWWRRAAAVADAGAGSHGGLTRRGFLGSVAAAVGAVTLLTVGQTVRPLRRLAVLAPRDPAVGPQGFPVNRSSAEAGVGELATDPGYRLVVDGDVRQPLSLTRDDLVALPQRQAVLPIACVEGWSATVTWVGVPVVDLLAMAGAPDGASVTVESLEPFGSYRTSELNRKQTADPDTLLALVANGQTLDLEHGYPVRLIGPNRPGVMNTKWVGRLRVHA